jgi:hypothetical protein
VRVVLVAVVAAIGIGAFYGGRASVDQHPVVSGSFAAGRESAFNGFDGGWSYGQPYIVVLRRGGAGVTYAFASREPMKAGLNYRRCGKSVCTSDVR